MKMNPIKKRASNKSAGFTMIEVLIALAILSIGLLAIATQQITATRSNTVSNKLTEGTTATQDKLEELISLDYDHADLEDIDEDGCGGLNDRLDDADYTEDPGKGYRISWNVCTDATSGLKRITVISQWGVATAGGGRTSVLSTVKPKLDY
jgi:prepilin-type N-terminal cleavage/methylation domain-containing protein